MQRVTWSISVLPITITWPLPVTMITPTPWILPFSSGTEASLSLSKVLQPTMQENLRFLR